MATFQLAGAKIARRLRTPCVHRARTPCNSVCHVRLTRILPLRRRYQGRAHRGLQLIKSVLPAISCPYIQERAAQSLLLASYTPLKLCEEAMLSEAWIVPGTVGFSLENCV